MYHLCLPGRGLNWVMGRGQGAGLFPRMPGLAEEGLPLSKRETEAAKGLEGPALSLLEVHSSAVL